ncbi:hypothetical protein ASG12_18940 [Williamsia sp. Leaf354]|jgi:alkylhydroperoxidase/carboxymuconolactone decarboxylase family protein YurZ|uniref:hypothetical protein n=1 Tax=Williamsia sp. Leaf354 TaxID=1736349 RepID=UPI0006F7ACE1|nr:hypothetical protein [Williamsia sp. Leaf354]KQR96668.1 hypothetical protein ASG12_18940 [Williamsia sp. Leaf354]
MPIDPDFFYALVVMNLLFVTAAWSLARPSVISSAILTTVAVVWVLANGPIEGHVILSFNLHHGVTESDLLSVIAVLIAGVGGWRVRRSQK